MHRVGVGCLWLAHTYACTAAPVCPPTRAANAKLVEANEKLVAVRAKVEALNAQLQALEQQYAAAAAEQDAALAQSEACQRKLDLANRLITALASGAVERLRRRLLLCFSCCTASKPACWRSEGIKVIDLLSPSLHVLWQRAGGGRPRWSSCAAIIVC